MDFENETPETQEIQDIPQEQPAENLEEAAPAEEIAPSKCAHTRGTDGVVPALPVAHRRSRDAAHNCHSYGLPCSHSEGNVSSPSPNGWPTRAMTGQIVDHVLYRH